MNLYRLFLTLQAPPDTSGYFLAGYAVIIGLLLVYMISLRWRRMRLERRLRALEARQEAHIPERSF